jgi:hypothetical protein
MDFRKVTPDTINYLSAINPLVAFYDINGGKREVLFFYFVPDTTPDDDVLLQKWYHYQSIDRYRFYGNTHKSTLLIL